jgi:hypothetical protein
VCCDYGAVLLLACHPNDIAFPTFIILILLALSHLTMEGNVSQIDNPPPVSIPYFRDPYCQQLFLGLDDPKNLSARMLKEDWMTPELLDEITGLLPESCDKDESGKRSPEAYLLKIAKLFPPGRVFASFKQLVQSSKMFLDAWAVQKVHGQKKITCSYGVNRGKRKKLHPDVLKRRNQLASIKNISCPFFI